MTKRVLVLIGIAVCVTGWTAHAEDFNLVAYTGHYNAAYPQGTIEDLQSIPAGPNGWPRITADCPGVSCPAEEIEIFLFISTDRSDGVGGIELGDPDSTDGYGNPRPSGAYSGDWDAPDTYVTLQNRAYWKAPPPAPGKWVAIHTEADANVWDGYSGYDAAADCWYFEPFTWFDLSPVEEDPSPPPGNAYNGNFYKGFGLQFDIVSGWVDPDLGANGQLVPYLHLVVNRQAMPCDTLTWISIAGMGATVDGVRPADYEWLGVHIDDLGSPFVPYGRVEFYCVPEPASLALLGLTAIPAIIRRRK